MWLDAIVTATDLQKVVDQLTPATVPLGDRGHLFFEAPVDISLVADRGVRVRCHAKLTWPVLGIDVGITIRSMTILVVPSIESRDGERVVVISPEVDALDLALLPDIGDDEVRAFINRALHEKRVELPWKYQQTLDHRFPLPEWFRAGAMFDIRSNGAAVKVTGESIGLAIGLSASVDSNQDMPAIAEGAPRNGVANHHPANHHPVNDPTRNHVADHHPANGHAWAAPRARTQNGALAVRGGRAGWFGLGVAMASGFGIGCLVGMRRATR